MESVYLAEFGSPRGSFFATALAWPAPAGPMLSPAWWRTLGSSSDVDIALRVTAGKEPAVLLLLTGDNRGALQSLVAGLVAGGTVTGLRCVRTAEEFDAMADLGVWHEHLRTHHEGYHRDGQPLGCDFRLYSAWVGSGLTDGVGYQLGLRSHPTGPEQERRVRKYHAWLELEQPFTPQVRELQLILSRRLLDPGWLADEYLLFSTEADRIAWQDRICEHFAETTGRIGFPEAPLEAGNFSEWLTTGYHTARDGETPPDLPVEAAITFSEDEIAYLTRQNLLASVQGLPGVEPDIFISYASSDFAQADATRQHLETAGRQCWIAPRDINITGLPYTEAILRAMRKVRAVVVVLSPAANISVHIPRELDLALERKLPIVPLRLDNRLPEGQLEYLLRTCQWLDLFDRNHDDGMAELDYRLSGLGI